MKELRNLIFILLAITTVVNSKVNNLSPEDLQELKRSIKAASLIMEIEAKNEDVAICIGSPKAGKSTLINYLMDNELIGERLSKNKPITISKANNNPGPAIGSGSISKTTFPTRWTSKNFPEMSLWDAPGFDDNRGPVQDITNAIYVYQLLQRVKSLKIILVIDINDLLKDNINPFLSVLGALENLFKDGMRYCFRSISVIFTKVPNTFHDVPVDKEFINDLLREKVLSSVDMSISQVSKEFIQFLIRNNRQMGLFKRAEFGPVTSAVDVNIMEAIRNSKSTERIILTQISPSISDSSMLVLYEAREALSSTSAFERLQDIIRDVIDFKVNKVQVAARSNDPSNTLTAIYEDLSNIQLKIYETLNSSLSFHEKISIVQSIDSAIATRIQQQDLLAKAKLMEVIDKLLDLKESNVFDINLQRILLSSLSKISESMVSISVALGKITLKQSEELLERERIMHIEELEKMNDLLREAQKHNAERENALFQIFTKFLSFAATKFVDWVSTRRDGSS